MTYTCSLTPHCSPIRALADQSPPADVKRFRNVATEQNRRLKSSILQNTERDLASGVGLISVVFELNGYSFVDESPAVQV